MYNGHTSVGVVGDQNCGNVEEVAKEWRAAFDSMRKVALVHQESILNRQKRDEKF